MENKYLLFMDVSGDIDLSVAEANDVRFIPMEYSIGDEMRLSTSMEPDDIIKRFYNGQRGGDLTRTSQITPQKYEECVAPVMEQGYSVLYLCLSSGLSSTFQSACMAQKNLKERFPEQDFLPVDSLAATGGMGVLMERAIRNRDKGMTVQENYADMVEAAHHIHHWFMVQDLNYLKRGGRVSAATAVVGTLLNVKPVLMIDEEGKLQTIAKERGHKSAIRKLIQKFVDTAADDSGDVIYVIDADNSELAEMLAREVLSVKPGAVIRRAHLSPIIGAHTGPDMIALCHMGK